MTSKFQEIINMPAVVVPNMTTEQIRSTLLESSIAYMQKKISLETLILVASKIRQFIGMRGEDGREVSNTLAQILSLQETN